MDEGLLSKGPPTCLGRLQNCRSNDLWLRGDGSELNGRLLLELLKASRIAQHQRSTPCMKFIAM